MNIFPNHPHTGLSLGSTFSEAFIDQYPVDSTVPFRSILLLIIVTTLWTLFLTVLPVFVDVPPDNYYTGIDTPRMLLMLRFFGGQYGHLNIIVPRSALVLRIFAFTYTFTYTCTYTYTYILYIPISIQCTCTYVSPQATATITQATT
ncbi:hypothetical protein EON63_16975 [archaeon]|nr:MAG: hypothetical protein EON63_16975 [archaeon]